MKFNTLALSALVALGSPLAWAQTSRLSSVAVTNGVVALTERTASNAAQLVANSNEPVYVGDNLAGLTFFNGNPGIDGLPASPTSAVLFTLTGALIPGGAATSLNAFMGYGTTVGPPTLAATYNDVAPLLAAGTTYSGLTFAAPNLYPLQPSGLIANEFYMINHATNGTDYLAAISPATGGHSAVLNIKPMSWPATGGVAATAASLGTNGYFALAFAAPTPTGSYFANLFYYLRTDTSSNTQFGYVIPAVVSASLDTLNITSTAAGNFGLGGFSTLAFADIAIGGYAANQFFYLRQDTVTGNTILGRLDTTPGNRTISDIANLGGVYKTLAIVDNATGPSSAWGTSQFFVTGEPLAAGAQSISFAAIPNHAIGDIFAVTPTASSGLDLVVTVVSGPATIQTTGVAGNNPSTRIFTVTTTGAGIVKLQATQAGQIAPLVVSNLMQQSFNVLGLPSITSATAVPATVNASFTYNITSTGAPILSYAATGLPATLTLNTSTGAITGTPLVSGIINATITATNATGTSIPATPLTITVAPAGVAPSISSATSAPGTVNSPFTYSILATNTPTSYNATGLPAGLTVNTSTGVISGTPSATGVTLVNLVATNGSGSGLGTVTITVAAAGLTPIITNSPSSAAGTAGDAFSFAILATGAPTSYGALGLPAGLVLNSATGVIIGIPTASGTSLTTLSATNATGTGTLTMPFTIGSPAVAPIITSPTAAPGTVGTPFVTYPITATGLPTSYTATGLPPGLTLNPLTGTINGTPTTPGTYVVTITATNSIGTSTATVTITIAAATAAPIITSPTSATGTAGTPIVTYPITATGLPTSFTATGLPPGLTLNPLTGTISGTPTASGVFVVTITATNSSGTSTTTLTITIAAQAYARIANFSARAVSGPGNQSMIVGFVVSSSGKNLLIRGIGPGLAAFGIASPLSDPMLSLFSGSSAVATNSGWQTSSSGQAQGALITATDTQVGAFTLQTTSADTALLYTVNAGAYTTNMLSPNGTSGVALTEIYDADVSHTPVARLVNVSARMNVTAGQGTLIGGFVIEGNIPQTVLIRGVGPALASYGVSNVLPDPAIAVYSGGTSLASDAGWGNGTGNAAILSAAAVQVGAFPLPSGSKDSALLITLQPGAYTVEVTSVSGATGVALIEVYDTQ